MSAVARTRTLYYNRNIVLVTSFPDSGYILLPVFLVKVDGKESRCFIGEHDIGSDHIAAILIIAFQVIEDDTFVYSDKALVRTIDTLVLLLIANSLYPFISASRDIAACAGINVIETLCVYIFSAYEQRFEQFDLLIRSGVFVEC